MRSTVLADHFRSYNLSNTVVVSPDLGNAKMASALARVLDVPVAAGSKQRLSDDTVIIDRIIGDVQDRDVIVLDDEIATGGSIIELLRKLRDEHVRQISSGLYPRAVHRPAIERLKQEPDILEIVTTNTVPLPPEKQLPNIVNRSVCPAVRGGRASNQSWRVDQQPVQRRADVRIDLTGWLNLGRA